MKENLCHGAQVRAGYWENQYKVGIFSLLVCLHFCLWGHELLPSGFAETMQSFVSLGNSFQWINALLPSPLIYHPVCALSESSDAVVSWSPVCLASSKICLKYPNNTTHMPVPVCVQSLADSSCYISWLRKSRGSQSRLVVCFCSGPCEESAFPHSSKPWIMLGASSSHTHN